MSPDREGDRSFALLASIPGLGEQLDKLPRVPKQIREANAVRADDASLYGAIYKIGANFDLRIKPLGFKLNSNMF